MTAAGTVALRRAEVRLIKRLTALEARVEAAGQLGNEADWQSYCEVVQALAVITSATAPEASGRLLTTAQLADRFGISPKTLLKRKRRGEIVPAVARGKLIRWAGDESL